MFGWGGATRIIWLPGATDMRKGFRGAIWDARDRLRCDPLSGHVVFCSPIAATQSPEAAFLGR